MFPLLLGFWEAFSLIVLILVFFGLYNKLSSGFINSPFLALIVTVIVVFIVVIPYEWFRYTLFAVLFLWGAFGEVKPWEWGK
ncbi:hypothetical protein COX85_03980 [Candidatus Micrarchaeota archaeon CG_4_10_14_0_2_um_filter_55_9]|nr:MAG: hypothetical protein AUJ15_01795 [Candidatus Micrarchaeota archaeon CG1_02_55_41]PIO03832.1 MAG: hypothetical protein COT57_00125 [Candidatus Micrarchaeota archaeon CG09_land_8_20_14_0_10_55_25]PIZ91427.1 MAG: hypothetical protein COX85_03980 [Candidatus Micrarchaeota archaeon CG_4_10_14_0_2_um_filter_55_9]PJD01371.1 MAG: hypothetical protein COU38_01275 [Candidatus Micrarchaeota archaeon CG10_big_fil_rev_8_21_14_0_10_54_18]